MKKDPTGKNNKPMKSKYDLTLTRAQYKKLYEQIDEKHEMKFAKADGYKEEMLCFLGQLDEAVDNNKPKYTFVVEWSVADALACSNYDLAGVFSSHMFAVL